MEVPGLLKIEPKLRRSPEQSSQSKRGVGRDRAFSSNDLIYPLKRDPNPLSELDLCHAERREKFEREHFTGMGRRAARGYSRHFELLDICSQW
jgi:hypothetical protein